MISARISAPKASGVPPEGGEASALRRSATSGVGTFTYGFDHMSELTGRAAETVIQARKAEAA